MDRYLTVAEVTDSARRLVSRFPGASRLRRIGTSRAGRPILMLSLGHGPHHILVVAGAHPDEPVSGVSALALAERVALGDAPSTVTDLSTVTWDIILCIDPDGATLSTYGVSAYGTNDATAPHTLKDYFGSAFRPMAAEQPEWAPIIGQSLPESRALFGVIDELRPILQCSLHSVDAGGSWVQLTRDLPELTVPFHASAKENAIPLQHGSYDALYWENPAAGIYVLPPEDSTDRLAAGSENIGRSTWCAPAGYGGVTAIIEVPLWATDLAENSSPHPSALAALHDLTALVLDGGRQVTAVLDKARGFLPPARTSPLRRVLEWMTADLYDVVAASWTPLTHQAAAAAHPDDPNRLTTAQVTALDVVARRQPLRAAGLLLRLLKTADDPAAPRLHRELNALFTTWCTDFERDLRLRRVPIAKQVEHQTRTITAAAESALTTAS